MPDAPPEFDCLKCGACCATFDVLLQGDDEDRFERKAELLALTVGYTRLATLPLRFMQRDDAGRCVALSGALGDCRCTIYEHRPALCRAFEAGSDDCREARRAHSIGQS